MICLEENGSSTDKVVIYSHRTSQQVPLIATSATNATTNLTTVCTCNPLSSDRLNLKATKGYSYFFIRPGCIYSYCMSKTLAGSPASSLSCSFLHLSLSFQTGGSALTQAASFSTFIALNLPKNSRMSFGLNGAASSTIFSFDPSTAFCSHASSNIP